MFDAKPTLISSLLITFIATSLMFTEPATAKWEYTTWSMTPDAVVIASLGKAVKRKQTETMPSGLLKSVTANYKMKQFLFKVSFLFLPESKTLDRVVLKLKNNDIVHELYTHLLSMYGEPDNKDVDVTKIPNGESHIVEWKNFNDKTIIKYIKIGKFYTIEYRPLKPIDN